jgi:hypothetical protein
MDPFVIAVREDVGGDYIGFLEDSENLECSQCGERAKYRLVYTPNEQGNIGAHRRNAQHMIEDEHPRHSDKIRVR